MNQATLSRRNFVVGSAAAVALATAAGSAAKADAAEYSGATSSADKPSWLGEKPVIDPADVEKEVEADVIIVGAGISGVSAARSAGEAGASVIVFEKGDSPKARSGEFAVIGGSLNEKWGREVDPELIINDHVKECNNFVKRSIISRWAYEIGDVFDWWIAAKPDLYICDECRSSVPDENAGCFLVPLMHPLPELYDYTVEEQPTYPSSVEFRPDQVPVVKANMEKAVAECDVTPYYGHFAEALINEGGRIVGVYARNAETGKYVKATAKGGVILACGDYASNKEMYEYYRPDLVRNGVAEMWVDMDVEGNPTNTGDGYRLAMWEGARIQQEVHAPCNHQMGGSGVFGYESTPTLGIAAFLQLNKDGKRFFNEDGNGQVVEHQLELQRDCISYQFFDSAWPEQIPHMQASHGVACYYEDGENLPKNNTFDRNYACPQGIEKGVEEGILTKADTIEELLDQIDIDKDQALATIEHYNEMAHAGKDTEFGKRSDRFFPLEVPPFYMQTITVNPTLVLFGGVESDEECHAYNEDREIIPGLYVCGNMQGNRVAVDYPISLKGVSHSLAMFYGYVAGKNSAKAALESSDK